MNDYRGLAHNVSGKVKYLEKTLLRATLYATNPMDCQQTWASKVRHTTVHKQDYTNTNTTLTHDTGVDHRDFKFSVLKFLKNS